jgi:hypothetical protein
MSKVKVKSSNTILNLLLIILGLLFIFQAVIGLLLTLGLDEFLPPFLGDIFGDLEGSVLISVFGGQALISLALGFWSLVAGVGMFKREEWAMGQALVILSIMVLSVLSTVIAWIIDFSSFDYTFWLTYITLATFIIGLIGFFWLLATRKRYD